MQTATLLILEPSFESGFEDSSYGFRPDRSAIDALTAVRAHVRSGRREVYDADLQSYFDTIPQDKLMRRVEMRVVDRSVLSQLVRLRRLVRHLQRRSQRPLRPPKNQTWYAYVHRTLGLRRI